VIRVLQNWNEIGAAIMALQRAGLPLHQTPQKNWDHELLRELVEPMDRNTSVIDLGCGDGYLLAMLSAMGFHRLQGVDFRITWRARVKQILQARRGGEGLHSYRLRRGDLRSTPFAAHTFQLVTSISTIEHGFDPSAFLTEASRLLCPQGILFVTTDYWQPRLEEHDHTTAFGLPWQILCREQIESFVTTAQGAGLKPIVANEVPVCSERVVFWRNRAYTFMAMAFRKGNTTR